MPRTRIVVPARRRGRRHRREGCPAVTGNLPSLPSRRRLPGLAWLLLTLALLTGCTGLAAPTPHIAQAVPSTTPSPTPAPLAMRTPEPQRCAGGRLRVR